MKKTILLTIIFVCSLALSCKKTENTSTTSSYNNIPCDCDDLTCWYNDASSFLADITCVLNTGLIVPGQVTPISDADIKKIKSTCNITTGIGSHRISLIQESKCSTEELKSLSNTYADKRKTDQKKQELEQKLADFEDPSSSLKTYDCSKESTSCNLSTMYLYGTRKNANPPWGTKLYDHCKDSCLNSRKATFCNNTLSNYIRDLNDTFSKKGFTISKSLSSSCLDSCQTSKPCSQAETLCLEQCCGGDWKCVMKAKE